ncbi:hypothetical protein KSS87_005341 [Heliosperma pusillum]|nr:hypothetical protein KSS87_005341 [Heliosperma pusillum]
MQIQMQMPWRLVGNKWFSHSNCLQQLPSTQPQQGVAKVVLKKGKTQLFKYGSPMVYSGAVDRIVGRPPPSTGDVVFVADGTEKPIGWGIYNSVSMFCVRLMQLQQETLSDPSCALNMERLLQQRINAATDLRNQLGLPSPNTNAYRLVNSEGDRLSGLIVDVFDDVAVVASSAAWVEKYKPDIEACIKKVGGITHINWRPSVEILKEEGLDLLKSETTPSPHRSIVKVKENDINYAVSLLGQKTGFYADQRENRQFIATIAKGKSVLDICCYSGGFALNALKGGAAFVTGVDSSLPALELAKENVILNDLDPDTVTFLKHDATDFMKNAASRNESWDIVILDPPKLAPRKEESKRPSHEIDKKGWYLNDLLLFWCYDTKWEWDATMGTYWIGWLPQLVVRQSTSEGAWLDEWEKRTRSLRSSLLYCQIPPISFIEQRSYGPVTESVFMNEDEVREYRSSDGTLFFCLDVVVVMVLSACSVPEDVSAVMSAYIYKDWIFKRKRG